MRKEKYNEERTDLIVGIITVVTILALFALLLFSVARRSSNLTAGTGEITAIGETRRGSEQVFTYNLDDVSLMEGARVTWTVNGSRIYEGAYVEGEAIELAYTPTQTGTLNIVATVGNYQQTATVEVKAPRLTVVTDNVTIVYGETPNLSYTVEGFVEGEECDFCFDGKCVAKADRLDVGVYEICMDKECSYMDYEMDYVCGKLTVLPKELTVENRFFKVYDSANTIENPKLSLGGVVEGDEVCAKCDTLYFDNKNVGRDKMIMLGNVELEGENACNYVLPDFVYGQIAPKQVEVVGLTVKDKLYDGTTKATIDQMGTLNGVCSGDSVAIGNISVSFEDANVGKKTVITHGVTLIGADKDNYVVREIKTPNAEISETATFWDKLLERERVAQGAN